MRHTDEVRAAETEALYREVNERIAESAHRFEAEQADFVCECSDPRCTHRIQSEISDYENVRRSPTRFLLADGHEDERIERVIERRRRANVVEKVSSVVAETVTRLNPRAA